MSDKEKLRKAHGLYELGKYAEARQLLETITTRDPVIRINVLSMFIGVLDHVSENDKLLDVASEGIRVATESGNNQMKSYFLGKKCFFLLSELSSMVYRQTNLVLSASVFDWIDFSLLRDKNEYEDLSLKRKALEEEIESTVATVIEEATNITDPEFKGHQLSTIGDIYSHKYLIDKLAHQKGGRLKSKIANIYIVRRWNLDRYLYKSEHRRKIDESRDKCIKYFEQAISEFDFAGKQSEQAHTIYNLAVKLRLFNRFKRAKKLLAEAKGMIDLVKDKPLLDKIVVMEKEVANKNRDLRDYVSEKGLDMPEGKHPFSN